MKNRYKDLKSLPDKELSDLVREIGAVLGGNESRTAALAADPARLKLLISSMDEGQIDALINRAGKEKAEQIKKALERRESNG